MINWIKNYRRSQKSYKKAALGCFSLFWHAIVCKIGSTGEFTRSYEGQLGSCCPLFVAISWRHFRIISKDARWIFDRRAPNFSESVSVDCNNSTQTQSTNSKALSHNWNRYKIRAQAKIWHNNPFQVYNSSAEFRLRPRISHKDQFQSTNCWPRTGKSFYSMNIVACWEACSLYVVLWHSWG